MAAAMQPADTSVRTVVAPTGFEPVYDPS